jgi:23S rRNA pseudouridine1911/1915/1917 synthase
VIKNPPIEILFEDDHIVVVSKPSGVLVIPDRAGKEKYNIKSIYDKIYGKIFICHRIDRDTSGVLILAKTEEAHKSFSMMFQKHQIDKKYWALINGKPQVKKATITLKIAESKLNRGEYVTSGSGVEAISHYEVLEELGKYCLVQVQIETGRTHQIRVHMKAINHPLAVDLLYGLKGKTGIFLSDIKKKYNASTKDDAERALISRLTLHAYSVEFIHPFTQEEMIIEAPLPKDFAITLKMLRGK